MEAAAASSSACEIARLPEDILALAISLTAPRDASRAAAVSPAFRAAAESDAVWSRFLPPPPDHLPPLADGELQPAPPSKKALFTRLSDGPVLLADGLVSMWLDRESGAKCYMLSARALCIVWGDTPQYWRWIPLTDSSRFAEAAELLDVCWLEIRGKMDSQMLSRNTKYAAYMVFKINDGNYGLDSPSQEAVVSTAENRSSREVCFQSYDIEDDEEEEVPENYRTLMQPIGRRFRRRTRRVPPPEPHVQLPRKRADGWMELEMGEFFNEGDGNREVSISLMEVRGGHWKKGLIVHGIEIKAIK